MAEMKMEIENGKPANWESECIFELIDGALVRVEVPDDERGDDDA